MTDLSILVPSRGRPDNAKRLLESFDRTWSGVTVGDVPSAGLVFILDEDDPMVEFYPPAGEFHANYYVPEWMPMVHKLNMVAQEYVSQDSPFAIGLVHDDHVFRTTAWDELILNQLNNMQTGYVYCDDGFQHGHLASTWFVTSNIVKAIGMVPAPVEHQFCDNSIMEVGQGAGCIRYLGDVLIEHMHPSAGKAEWDAQYRRVNGGAQCREDRERYRTWRDAHLPDAVEAVKRLRDV